MLLVLIQQLGWDMTSSYQLKALKLHPHLSIKVWAPRIAHSQITLIMQRKQKGREVMMLWVTHLP